MLEQHSMSIAQQLKPIYNTAVHKNKSNVALYIDTCWCYYEEQHAIRANQNYWWVISRSLFIKDGLRSYGI